MGKKRGQKEKLNGKFYCVLGSALNNSELMEFFNTYRLSDESMKYAREHGINRRKVAKQLFCKALKLIINDIIDNRSTFRVPTYKGESYIQMRAYEGEEFKDMYRRGMFNKVDFLRSFFTGYRLHYLAKCDYKKDRDQMIYVSANERDKIIENTNKGIAY